MTMQLNLLQHVLTILKRGGRGSMTACTPVTLNP